MPFNRSRNSVNRIFGNVISNVYRVRQRAEFFDMRIRKRTSKTRSASRGTPAEKKT